MRTPTVERPARATATATGSRSRRHRWIGLTALVVALMLAAGTVALARYQPLEAGCCAGASGTTYRQGAPFSYALSVVNHGFLLVLITGIDTGEGHALVRTTGISIMREGPVAALGDIRPDLYQPFEPFTLGAGEERGILVQNVFDGCRFWAPRSSDVFVAIHVEFSVLGMPGDTWMALGTHYSIASPSTCPGRTN